MQIDGRKINKEIGEKLKQEIEAKNIKPSLGILCVGDDKASLSFINVKKRFGEKYGFAVNILNLSPRGERSDEVGEIKTNLIKMQSENDGVILQLPLPEKFKDYTEEILKVIEKEKDVDDLNEGNFEAPIVLALEKVLEEVEPHLASPINRGGIVQLKFGIVGLGQVVGLPIKNYLENKIKSNSKEIGSLEIIGHGEFEKIKNCDVVISGVGSPNLITKEFIKQGSILIDYGCSYDSTSPSLSLQRRRTEQLFGDFDKSCYEKAAFYTPVPGCMGPLVVASLFENVYKAFLKSYEKEN